MPGGKYDSSKTRVAPVFDKLRHKEDGWIKQLLTLPTDGCGKVQDAAANLKLLEWNWSPEEKALKPPVALLSWLIRNGKSLRTQDNENLKTRALLREGDPDTVEKALELLRTEGSDRGWYVFEGPTCPDVYLETPDALIVVEGKRTERTPTTYTKWLDGRHQIWRHIDAAWEIRGRRKVYGFFIVEGNSTEGSLEPPGSWKSASQGCFAKNSLLSSFPHRSAEEAVEISKCFLGITTWQKVCATFGIDYASLPHEVPTVDQKEETAEPAE